MDIPFILEIAISLVFVYIILSLLASELQELLTSVLQWRAAHLKKSIEILLNGGANEGEDKLKTAAILDKIYKNPLIQNMSQKSQGGIEQVVRDGVRAVIVFGRDKTKLTLVGDEPSYIPSETFATTLLEQLELSQFTHKLTALKLKVLMGQDILGEVHKILDTYISTELDQQTDCHLIDTLRRDQETLRKALSSIRIAVSSGKISLKTAVYRLKSEVNNYIRSTGLHIQSLETTGSLQSAENDESAGLLRRNHPLLSQLNSIQQGIFYADDHAGYDNIEEVIQRLQPSLLEVLDIFKEESSPAAVEQYRQYWDAYDKIRKEAQAISKDLPYPVQKSLAALARRAEINLKKSQNQIELIQDELKQFKVEIQNWFDRSMDRASGVYKRNAKGVGFLIGLLLAIAINADTLHIINRLANDSTLREALVSNADILTSACVPPASSAEIPAPEANSVFDCITKAVNREIPLPLGWNPENLTQQNQEGSLIPLPAFVRKVVGWAITGIAIAMGASFWFDLLGKIMNVRNAGRRPDTKVDTALPDKGE